MQPNPPKRFSSLKCSMTSSPKDFSMIILREALSASHSLTVSERRSGKGRTLGVGSGEVPSTLALFYLDLEEITACLGAIGRVGRKGKKRKNERENTTKKHQQTIIRTQTRIIIKILT